MLKLRRILMAVVAASVFGAVIASASSATLRPTWVACEKSRTGTLAADCNVAGSGWEAKELSGSLKLDFKSGVAKLYRKSTEEVICLKDEGNGEISNSTIGGEAVGINKKVVIKFLECTYVPNKSCEINGKPEDKGEITTESLDSILAYKPGGAQVVDVLLPESPATNFANFTVSGSAFGCSLGKIIVKGSIIGLVLPQKEFALLGLLHFEVEATSKKQAIESYEEKLGSGVTVKDVLSCSFFGGIFEEECSQEGLGEIEFLNASSEKVAVEAKPN